VNTRMRRWWRDRWSIAVTLAVCVFTFVAVVVPIWLVVVNSFKGTGEASALGIWLPERWQVVENYATVIVDGKLALGLRNSLLIVVPSVILIVIFSSAAAWVFARGRSRKVSVTYYAAISGILLPVAIITSIQVLQGMSLRGTFPGMVLFYVGTTISVGIFLVTGFIKTIPIELEEAARIDGAGSFRIFARIIFPLLRPIIATLSFITLLFLWNDFFTPFFLMPGQDNQTLMLGLYSFISRTYRSTEWGLVFADVILVSLPLIVVYLFTQRWIVTGLLGAGTDK
jgi:raffinose/stachyose/melibiose transport system permease protein